LQKALSKLKSKDINNIGFCLDSLSDDLSYTAKIRVCKAGEKYNQAYNLFILIKIYKLFGHQLDPNGEVDEDQQSGIDDASRKYYCPYHPSIDEIKS